MKRNKLEVVRIETFEQLKSLCDEPLLCRFELDGKIIELPVKRLTAGIKEQAAEILRAPQPPFDKVRGDYDYLNPAFLKARDKAEREARAIIIYYGCEAVSKQKPGLPNRTEIYNFVQSLLPEMVLEMIALTIQKGGVDLAERVNFTSTAASES